MGVLSSVRPRCFLSTPMRGEFAELRSQLAAALEQAGVDVPLIEHQPTSRALSEVSRELLRQCHFVIADLTTSNPNVIYEVGLAHGIGLPVLLLTRSLDSAPPALLRDNLFLVYDPAELSQLVLRVMHWVARQSARGASR